jgi:thioredoxin-like negative regulator of GroEL
MDKNLKKKIVNLEKKIKKKKNPYLESSKKVNKKGKKEMKKSEKKKEVDLHNKYYLALQYFEHSDFEKAINTLLEIIKIDKNWNNKNALNFLLKIFSFLGANNKISIEGKKNLSKILF